MHDDLGSYNRGVDSLAGGQVTGHELDTLPGRVAASAEHSHFAPGVLQPRNDKPPEGAGAAGDQSFHNVSPCHICSGRGHFHDTWR